MKRNTAIKKTKGRGAGLVLGRTVAFLAVTLVLIVAISRHVILSHADPVSNIACVLCIAGLFATRRFLIPRKEMKVELSEVG